MLKYNWSCESGKLLLACHWYYPDKMLFIGLPSSETTEILPCLHIESHVLFVSSRKLYLGVWIWYGIVQNKIVLCCSVASAPSPQEQWSALRAVLLSQHGAEFKQGPCEASGNIGSWEQLLSSANHQWEFQTKLLLGILNECCQASGCRSSPADWFSSSMSTHSSHTKSWKATDAWTVIKNQKGKFLL